MGRHFEVRQAAMAATAKAKSAVYMRASKEIYMAAKRGIPDPESNLALRAAIDKFRKSCPKDVIERAIKKAQGGDATNYLEGRYEAFGPGGSLLIVDTLTDNTNRALISVRTALTRKGGHLGSVAYNFSQSGLMDFKYSGTEESLEEALVLGDVDVKSIDLSDGDAEVVTAPNDIDKAKEALKALGVTDYDYCQSTLLANERIELDGDDKKKFEDLLSELDELEDVQNVYHNVIL
jgi:YebC/PmpR family DNA-binding regulatory protein